KQAELCDKLKQAYQEDPQTKWMVGQYANLGFDSSTDYLGPAPHKSEWINTPTTQVNHYRALVLAIRDTIPNLKDELKARNAGT
ncbi:MAG: hypothetical protein MI861_20505, partial [Pirellulales bacterium]|nr:hypothetical protein [Pirellulales bacterium]